MTPCSDLTLRRASSCSYNKHLHEVESAIIKFKLDLNCSLFVSRKRVSINSSILIKLGFIVYAFYIATQFFYSFIFGTYIQWNLEHLLS